MKMLNKSLGRLYLLLAISTIAVDGFVVPNSLKNSINKKNYERDNNDLSLSIDDYLVDYQNIPGLSQLSDVSTIPDMFAGHIPLFGWNSDDNDSDEQDDDDEEDNDDDDDNVPEDFGYFFWKFHDKRIQLPDVNSSTLIFWLNGGPGCSSMDGALVENGPLRIDEDGKAKINLDSWISRADIVYIDQPVGTGFSAIKKKLQQTTKLPLDSNLDEVSLHFCQFLINYFKVFPEDLDKDIILAGESYAGQYIPYIASFIQKNNLKQNYETYPFLQENLPYINLYSVLIGNGWIDPITQSLSYLPFAVEHNVIEESNPNFKQLLNTHENCQKKINLKTEFNIKDQFSIPECDKIINDILVVTKSKDAKNNDQCINVYNYELKDSYPACGMNWPADITHVSKFFSNKEVRDALHINSVWAAENWIECRKDVMDHMTNKGSRPSINLFPTLLENGLNIILFNGDKDLICNNKGVLDTIDNLEWGGIKGFSKDVQNYNWIYRSNDDNANDQAVGYVQYDRNLTFISVFNASHMVPHDKGRISRGIVDITLNNVLLESLDKRQSLISSDTAYTDEYFDEDEDQNYDYEYTEDDVDYENGTMDDPKYHNVKGIISSIILLLILIGCYAVYSLDKWWAKSFSRSQGAYNRLDRNTNKSVTWADETIPDMDFEMGNMNTSGVFDINDENEEEGSEEREEENEDQSNSNVPDLNIIDDSFDISRD